jgi:hypothetical protein
MINRSILITVLTAALVLPAVAQVPTPLQLNQTYNSGYSGSTKLAAGAFDTDFLLYTSPYGIILPVVASPIPVAWGTPPAGAQWISPTENQQDGPGLMTVGNPPGTYLYHAELDTDFLIPTVVTFTGEFESDNSVELDINGVEVTTAANPDFVTPDLFSASFTINSGSVVTPINFIVTNLKDSDPTNPTGLLVIGLKASAAAPEPGTWLLLFGGAAALALVQRLRGASIL